MEKAPYLVAKDENTVQILIDDEIGFWGVTAQSVISQIKESGAKNIELRINSVGGDVTDALSIYNFLKDYKGIVTTKVDGLAASAATVIAQAANPKRRYTAESAIWMVHEASIGAGGKKAELQEAIKVLDVANESIKSIYMANGISEDVVDSMFDGQDHWFSGAQAIEMGFSDKTYNASSNAQAKAYAIAASATNIPEDVKNKLKNNKDTMKKNLMEAISGFFSNAAKDDFKIEDAKTAVQEIKDQYESEVKANDDKVNDLQAKVDGFETEKETAIQDAVKPLNEEKKTLTNQVKDLEKQVADLQASIKDNKGAGDKTPEHKTPEMTEREKALEANAAAIREMAKDKLV